MAYADVVLNRDRARARSVVESLSRRLLSAVAARRQGIGSGEGARAPLALGQPRRSLSAITEAKAGPTGPVEAAVTPLGYKTARAALPPFLAQMDRHDPKLQAATMLADAVERIGSIKGGDMGGGDIKGGISDGGATTRVKHAARLRLIEALANGWAVDRSHGSIIKGAECVVLKVRRQRGKAKDIRAMRLLELICIEGLDMRQILELHGWSAHSGQRKALGAAASVLLDDVAEGLGLGRGR